MGMLGSALVKSLWFHCEARLGTNTMKALAFEHIDGPLLTRFSPLPEDNSRPEAVIALRLEINRTGTVSAALTC